MHQHPHYFIYILYIRSFGHLHSVGACWLLGTPAVRNLFTDPALLPACPPLLQELLELLNDCTHSDPKQRPSARECYERLLRCPPLVPDAVVWTK